MFGFLEYEFTSVQWSLLAISAFLVGIAKTGLPGVGILVVPLMVMVLPAKESVGLLLGMLIIADLFSASYYRRKAQWNHLLRLFPSAFAGIVAGWFFMGKVNDQQLKPIIGAIVLVMLIFKAFTMFGKKSQNSQFVPSGRGFSIGMGFCAGVTTMMANAAGPVMILYLLAMKLDKQKFIGTAAWFFFIINWVKVPFNLHRDMMSLQSITVDAMMIPFITLGAVTGIYLLKVIPRKLFNLLALLLAAAASIRLIASVFY